MLSGGVELYTFNIRDDEKLNLLDRIPTSKPTYTYYT